jgi:hypothetical protein
MHPDGIDRLTVRMPHGFGKGVQICSKSSKNLPGGAAQICATDILKPRRRLSNDPRQHPSGRRSCRLP